MSTLETVLLSLLVLDAIALIVLVLLQQGKGADVGAAFGSGASTTMFGSAGSTSFLTKMTAWLAVALFAITFALAYTANERAAAAGSAGIPVVNSDPGADVLTPIEESVNSTDSDIPALEVGTDEDPSD